MRSSTIITIASFTISALAAPLILPVNWSSGVHIATYDPQTGACNIRCLARRWESSLVPRTPEGIDASDWLTTLAAMQENAAQFTPDEKKSSSNAFWKSFNALVFENRDAISQADSKLAQAANRDISQNPNMKRFPVLSALVANDMLGVFPDQALSELQTDIDQAKQILSSHGITPGAAGESNPTGAVEDNSSDDGEMVTIDPSHPPAYFAAARSSDGSSQAGKPAVVILTDIYGLPINNPKINADAFRDKLGVDVYVPDMFEGTPPLDESRIVGYGRDEPSMPYIQQLWRKICFYGIVLTSISGLRANRAPVLAQRMQEFIQALKAKGYTDIGLVGYCLGGTVAAHLAPTDAAKTAVLLHPGKLTPDEVRAFKIPTLWISPEGDDFLGPKELATFESILREKEGIPCEFTVYPGTMHGFASRPNQALPVIKRAYEDALEQTAGWLKTHLLS
ncbi:hypothetical protein FRB99_003445 [Tulasnella sp. 403]|nr:hypothetical protein FRB99_003445 [Tulasnella sp. 403]